MVDVEGGVKTTKYLPPGKRWLPVFPHFNQRSGSAVARSGSGNGSAVDAGVKTTLLYYGLVPFLSGER